MTQNTLNNIAQYYDNLGLLFLILLGMIIFYLFIDILRKLSMTNSHTKFEESQIDLNEKQEEILDIDIKIKKLEEQKLAMEIYKENYPMGYEFDQKLGEAVQEKKKNNPAGL